MARAQKEKIQPTNDGAIHYSVRKAEKTDFACRNAKAKVRVRVRVRLSNQQLREMLGMESVQRMLRQRRLQWVAHSARRGQGDFTWKGMMREVEDERVVGVNRYARIGMSWK